MALKHIEGFDWIPLATTGSTLSSIMNERYTGVNTTSGTDAEIVVGRDGVGNGIEFNNGSQAFTTNALRPPAQASNEIIIGIGVKTPSTILTSTWLLVYDDDTATNSSANIRMTATGLMRLYRGNTFISEITTLLPNTWYYIEFKLDIEDAGSAVVRVNGVEVLDFSGDLQADTSTWTQVRFVSMGNGCVYDDIYIADTTGGINDDFLGPVNIRVLRPNGAGNENDWTASDASPGANHYLLVDDVGTDGDATYIESNTTNERELFAHENTSVSTAILGVQQSTSMRTTDGIPVDVTLSSRLAPTTVDTSATSISTTSYTHVLAIYDDNPVSSLAWTDTDLNSMEFGVRID